MLRTEDKAHWKRSSKAHLKQSMVILCMTGVVVNGNTENMHVDYNGYQYTVEEIEDSFWFFLNFIFLLAVYRYACKISFLQTIPLNEMAAL